MSKEILRIFATNSLTVADVLRSFCKEFQVFWVRNTQMYFKIHTLKCQFTLGMDSFVVPRNLYLLVSLRIKSVDP